jgi:hypothetical protein
MKIDCGRCMMRGGGCRDCVVSALNPPSVTRYPSQAPGYLDEAEIRALGALANAGLVPPLRLLLPGSEIRPEARSWIFPEAKAS